MEEIWLAKRDQLRSLLSDHPEYSLAQLATATQASIGWVKKWKKIFKQADLNTDCPLFSKSRRPHSTPPRIAQTVVETILAIRDHPPQNLQRTPGPKAICYYLKQETDLLALGLKIPTSPTTIWRILKANGRIAKAEPHPHKPFPRPAPLEEWQVDFKDCGLLADPNGKKQHVVESLNLVDVGTSILVEAIVREDFKASTVIKAMAQTFQENGKPKALTFDRDTRFVGSWSGRDFPAAFVRFLGVLGIKTNICPPHRPDLNGIVERYNKTYGQECLKVFKPGEVGQVREVTGQFKQHYNFERPHQGISCQNRPPRVAFPDLPALPALPLVVNPDGWLKQIDKRYYARRVKSNGAISLDNRNYYIQKSLAKQEVLVQIEAASKEFVVLQGHKVLKRVKLKGLYNRELSYEEYLKAIMAEAKVEERRKGFAKLN